MRNGLANVRRVDVDITGLTTGIGGRMCPVPLVIEELNIHRCNRQRDVERGHVMHVE
jgi:hypothetical protein